MSAAAEAPGVARRRRGWRRAGRTSAGVVAVAALAGTATWLLAGSDRSAPPVANDRIPLGTATVERRDLVDRESISGTLGYADTGTLAAGAAGMLTSLRDPGSVITRGHSLYALDDAAAAFLLYGELPAWRDFTPWMNDGEDVRQLERNLRALGHRPGDVDGHWDDDTTEAVERFQRARALDDDGTLSRGEIVFRPGATRIGEAKAEVGDQLSPGRPLAELSSTERLVTVPLEAARQRLARVGDKVTVDLPSGKTVNGRIEEVGKVATQQREEEDPTIDVTITLGDRGGNLDQAPVDVGFAVERRRGALAVPVKALLARQGGGYALELVGGGMVSVTPGLYADDMVEVDGPGLRAGQRVVTAS
jgi:peptidoglycan hydrolase-like protein with peptidoglycan-binding domain